MALNLLCLPVYSNTLTQQITSYGLSLYVPGDYQGWNPAAAPQLAPVAGRAGLYEGYVNITGSRHSNTLNTPTPPIGTIPTMVMVAVAPSIPMERQLVYQYRVRAIII